MGKQPRESRMAGEVSARRPVRDDVLAALLGDPTLDLGPWAAFVLGHEPRMIPVWLSVIPTAKYSGPSSFDGTPLAVYRTHLAAERLSEVVAPGVLKGIRAAGADLDRHADVLAKSFLDRRQQSAGAASGWRLARRLNRLADRAIPETSTVAPWYRLGRELGEFRCHDHFEDETPFRPVVVAARELPNEERAGLSDLPLLAGLCDRPGAETEEGLRAAYVHTLATDWPDPEVSPWPNSPIFSIEVRLLHDRIERHLLERTRLSPPTPDLKPQWNRGTGELTFGGKLVRKLAVQAVQARDVLDEFERAGWTEWVETSLTGENRKGVKRSLNSGIQSIRFYLGGSPKGIGWRIDTDR